MARRSANTRLKAARQAAGLASQQALADAMLSAAPSLGLRTFQVSVRQVRRWETASPPWPSADHQRLLCHVLRLPIDQLGFQPPWSTAQPPSGPSAAQTVGASGAFVVPPVHQSEPGSLVASNDYMAITCAHRHLYWHSQPAHLHAAVVEHANLGGALLAGVCGAPRSVLASALAESLLLAARIEFFDMRHPDRADLTLVRALQAAGEAADSLLGAAILAHAAFVPGWGGRAEEASERMVAARTYARRAPASAEILAWLNAVEAECLTHNGDHRGALSLLVRAEEILYIGNEHNSPDWMDWFSAARLAAFKGNTQFKAGNLSQARATLQQVLVDLGPDIPKQRAVVLADLGAVEAADQNPEDACALAHQALRIMRNPAGL
jgi:transcriptional regulator with XRE-family HTH domain